MNYAAKPDLGADTSFCNGFAYTLLPNGNWNSYLWSDGSAAPLLNIGKTGLYWLKVFNNDGCSATDSIMIYEKSCDGKLYFPNAFTPNGDSKNDVFKPVVKALPEKYHLVVYNRLGQKIFETTNVNLGWKGIIDDRSKHKTETYVWYCHYEIRGQQQMQKSTVLLIY